MGRNIPMQTRSKKPRHSACRHDGQLAYKRPTIGSDDSSDSSDENVSDEEMPYLPGEDLTNAFVRASAYDSGSFQSAHEVHVKIIVRESDANFFVGHTVSRTTGIKILISTNSSPRYPYLLNGVPSPYLNPDKTVSNTLKRINAVFKLPAGSMPRCQG